MKRIFYSILILFLVTLTSANTNTPKIRVYINDQEINYNQTYNEIRPGDMVRFEAELLEDGTSLSIDGYTVDYFDTKDTGSSKFQHQTMSFTKTFDSKNKTMSKTIIVSIDDLRKIKAFYRIDIQLGMLYLKSTSKQQVVSTHSSNRTFSFLFYNLNR